MKKWISFLCHLALIAVMTSFATFTEQTQSLVSIPDFLKTNVQGDEPYFVSDTLVVADTDVPSIFLGKAYHGFKEALAFKESQGNYDTINTLGYLGKYQFGKNTLKLMGVYDTETFMADASLQEELFSLNVARNKWILRREIKLFNGKRIGGATITESGIIAAAHLAGAGNVKKYLRSYGKVDVADAYGSTIAYYMRKFEGYDISAVTAKHNPRI